MAYVSAKDIINWVDSQTVDRNSIDSVTNFVKDLQNQMNNLDFKLPDGCEALGYSGSVDSTGVFKTIENITNNSNGQYGFINNVADNILNYKYTDDFGVTHSLNESIKDKVGQDWTDIIFDGDKSLDIRPNECFPEIKTLNDYISDKYMLNNAKEDVTFLIMEGASPNSVAARTEIPRLMQMDSVTSINGVSKSYLLSLSEAERFEVIKNKSILDLRDAAVYTDALGKNSILSFENTRFANEFKTQIPSDYILSGTYGKAIGILDDIELKNKYAFLKVIGDQETLDAYRLADYQSTRSGGGIGITADTPVYLNNKGKRIVIDFDGSYVPDDTTIKTTVSELTEAFNDAEFNKIEDFSELSADEKVKIKRKLTECEGDYGTGNPLYKNLSQLKARDLLELLKNETGLDDLTDVAKNYKGLNSMAKTTKALRGAFGLSIITLSNFESDFFLRKNYFENLEALYIVTKKSIAKL